MIQLPTYLAAADQDVLVPDRVALDELHRAVAGAAAGVKAAATVVHVTAPPSALDLSEHLRFIRCQGGDGCWGYSLLSVWDIMNELACPFVPNLSLNLGLFLHRRRDLHENLPPGTPRGINSPDGRFHANLGDHWLEQSFGCTTEGTELTHPSQRWIGSWTAAGVDEAGNYRLAAGVKVVPVESAGFIQWLASRHPLQLEDDGHVLAIVGYDASNKTFKFANSWGDRWGDGGYGTYTFAQIDKKQGLLGPLGNAYALEIVPPRPVPTARIWFRHSDRMNVTLWLSAENSPQPAKKIWPTQDWADNSCNLHYTVRLPREFIWPPSPGNRLVLDLYDSAAFSETGGELVEFTAAFGGHAVSCSALANGPVSFKPREHNRFCIQ